MENNRIMSLYLKLFETHSQYESYTADTENFLLPNVSFCIDTPNEVHYNPYVPPTIDGHEYVDLGLPSGTKWAKMNVGASRESDYGNYYQYGKGSAQYAATSGDSDYIGVENPLATSADTAVQVMGGQWHIPTKTQFEELIANTTYEWATINGVNGGKFTATNGNYVFFHLLVILLVMDNTVWVATVAIGVPLLMIVAIPTTYFLAVEAAICTTLQA